MKREVEKHDGGKRGDITKEEGEIITVETPMNIKFGKVLSPLQFINELGDEG